MRTLILSLVALACLAPPAAADQEELVVAIADWELLPLDELEKARLLRDHAEIAGRITALAQQIERADKELRARKDPADEGSVRLRQTIARTAEALAPHLRQLTVVLRQFDIDQAVLARIQAAPGGPNRVSRYAHRLVLEVDPTAAQGRVLEPLVAAVDGAQLALNARSQRLDRLTDQEATVRGLRQDLEAHRREIERRFWIVVDCVLETDQKVAVRELLPQSFSRHDDPVGHLLRLPGLTVGQSSRLRALIAEIESESAADNAAVKRLTARLRDKELPADERPEIATALREAQGRLLDLRLEIDRQGKEILSAEQLDAYRAIPPFVNSNDRNLRPESLIDGIRLSDDQRRRLTDLAGEYKEKQAEYQAEARRIQQETPEAGPDSPQRQMMEMKMMTLQGEGQTAMRAAASRLYLEFLTPTQIVDWVLGVDETK